MTHISNAILALRSAISLLAMSAPNPHDFRLERDFLAARLAHRARMSRLEAVISELEGITEGHDQ